MSLGWPVNGSREVRHDNALLSFLVSPPFSSSEPQKIYAKILDGVLKYPPYLSEASKSIISKLCRWRTHVTCNILYSDQAFELEMKPMCCLNHWIWSCKGMNCWNPLFKQLEANVRMLCFYLQTSAGSEVRKHQEWNKRCAASQVILLRAELQWMASATAHSQCAWPVLFLIFIPQVVQQYELAQAACGSTRRPHSPTHTQGKSKSPCWVRPPVSLNSTKV